MFNCVACASEESKTETVEQVFKVDGRYVLVGDVPSTVCIRCGEPSVTREVTERVRQLVHDQPDTGKSVPLQVYQLV